MNEIERSKAERINKIFNDYDKSVRDSIVENSASVLEGLNSIMGWDTGIQIIQKGDDEWPKRQDELTEEELEEDCNYPPRPHKDAIMLVRLSGEPGSYTYLTGDESESDLIKIISDYYIED
jgi:hypothetical protein